MRDTAPAARPLLLIGDAERAMPLARDLTVTHGGAMSVVTLGYALGRALGVPDTVSADGAIAIELSIAASSLERQDAPSLAKVERDAILRTLARCNGNRTLAADLLGISVRTMRNKLRLFVGEGVAVTAAPSNARGNR